jgi:DUF917 family protein
MLFDEELVDRFIVGLTILGGGGGGNPKAARALLKKTLSKGEIDIRRVNELKAPIGPSVYPVGSSAIPAGPNEDALLEKAFLNLQSFTGLAFNSIVPVEIGPDVANYIALSQRLGVTLIDGDLTGGRAAPKVYQNVYFMNNIPIAPMAVVAKGFDRIITDVKDDIAAEAIIRGIAGDLKSLIGVADHPLPLKKYVDILPSGTISLALDMGNDFTDSYPDSGYEILKSKYDCKVIFEGIITSVDTTSGGFLTGSITLNSGEADLSIFVLNEFIYAKLGKKVVAKFPDLICLFNKNGKCLTSSELRKGGAVTVMLMPCNPVWNTGSARKLNKKFFGEIQLNNPLDQVV